MIGKQLGVPKLSQGAATSVEVVQGHTGSSSGRASVGCDLAYGRSCPASFHLQLVAARLLVLQPLLASSNLPAVVHPLCIS